MQRTARIWPEEGGFVADCVELSVVSQGDTEEEALSHLQEAVAGFLEYADPSEVRERIPSSRIPPPYAPTTRTHFPSNATANACTGLAPAARSSLA